MPAPVRFPISDHCDGRCFFNPSGEASHSWWNLLEWRCANHRQPWPDAVRCAPEAPPAHPPPGRLRCTWINHSTFLLQCGGLNLLTDPVYSNRAGPLGLLGPRRVHPPGVPFANLPRIDAVLLSHDHYDHCDLAALRRLAREHAPLAVTPLGNGELLRLAGFAADRIVELDWWLSCSRPEPLKITLTPARHWSNRVRGATNSRLWGGFYLQTTAGRIFFAGDTGYDPQLFTAIRQRWGTPDLALLPIGAYEPRWLMQPHHCNPDEAVRAHRELGARISVAMHWGTFPLTDEAREAPLRALAKALARQAVPASEFRVLVPGQTLLL